MPTETGPPENRRSHDVQLAGLSGEIKAVATLVDTKFELLRQQIEFTDRNAGQFTSLVKDELGAIKEKVGEDRTDIHARVDGLEHQMDEGFKNMHTEVSGLKESRAKLIGIALGIAAISGGTAGFAATIAKGLGGG